MEELLKNIPGWLQIVIFLAAVIGTVYIARDKLIKKKVEIVDKAEGKLITILQGTVNEMEKQQTKHHDQIKTLEGQVKTLEGANGVMRDILQGRDEATVRFQNAGMTAFATVAGMAVAFERHLKVIEEELLGRKPKKTKK